ncbi:MAG: hypothetical protein ACLSTO_00230 [Bilophila wadsworthia]
MLIVTSFFADETDAHSPRRRPPPRPGRWTDGKSSSPHPTARSRTPQNPYGGAEPPSVVDGPIGNFLAPGTVVWASNSTTVALEAAFRKLPVLVQAAEDDVDLALAGLLMWSTSARFRRGRRPRRSQGPRPARTTSPSISNFRDEGTVGL